MSKRNNESFSSGAIIKLGLFIVKLCSFPIRRPVLFVFMLGTIVVVPVVSGSKITSYQDLLTWYNVKAEPVTRRFQEFGDAFARHFNVKDTVDVVKREVALNIHNDAQTLKAEALPQEIRETASQNASSEEKKKLTPEEEFALSLKAGSIYGYEPIVVAQKFEDSDNSASEESPDFEQPKEVIVGKAKAVGGDRIIINDKLLRLDGISVAQGDADVKAQKFLSSLVEGQDVECLVFEYTENKIPLGWCFVHEEEINSKMIDNGFALSY
ncbi:MAG: thermonuclease family protein [Alphaproteobacteria bacterium]